MSDEQGKDNNHKHAAAPENKRRENFELDSDNAKSDDAETKIIEKRVDLAVKLLENNIGVILALLNKKKLKYNEWLFKSELWPNQRREFLQACEGIIETKDESNVTIGEKLKSLLQPLINVSMNRNKSPHQVVWKTENSHIDLENLKIFLKEHYRSITTTIIELNNADLLETHTEMFNTVSVANKKQDKATEINNRIKESIREPKRKTKGKKNKETKKKFDDEYPHSIIGSGKYLKVKIKHGGRDPGIAKEHELKINAAKRAKAKIETMNMGKLKEKWLNDENIQRYLIALESYTSPEPIELKDKDIAEHGMPENMNDRRATVYANTPKHHLLDEFGYIMEGHENEYGSLVIAAVRFLTLIKEELNKKGQKFEELENLDELRTKHPQIILFIEKFLPIFLPEKVINKMLKEGEINKSYDIFLRNKLLKEQIQTQYTKAVKEGNIKPFKDTVTEWLKRISDKSKFHFANYMFDDEYNNENEEVKSDPNKAKYEIGYKGLITHILIFDSPEADILAHKLLIHGAILDIVDIELILKHVHVVTLGQYIKNLEKINRERELNDKTKLKFSFLSPKETILSISFLGENDENRQKLMKCFAENLEGDNFLNWVKYLITKPVHRKLLITLISEASESNKETLNKLKERELSALLKIAASERVMESKKLESFNFVDTLITRSVTSSGTNNITRLKAALKYLKPAEFLNLLIKTDLKLSMLMLCMAASAMEDDKFRKEGNEIFTFLATKNGKLYREAEKYLRQTPRNNKKKQSGRPKPPQQRRK